MTLPAGVEDHVAAVLEAWTGKGLEISDRRSKMMFVAGEGPDVIAYYAVLCGLANRWVDVQVKGVALDMPQIYEEGRGLSDAGRSSPPPKWAQVGGEDPRHMPHVAFEPGTPLSPEAVSMIRWASRLRMVPPRRVKPALECFALVAGIRETKGHHWPVLSTGLEPEPKNKNTSGQGIDLEKLWQRISMNRRRRVRDDYEIVEAETGREDYRKLADANVTPIDSVLLRLGSSATTDGPPVWACPRPDRHKERNPRPTLRIRDNKAGCHVCDKEPLTPAQLVADTLEITPDEAAAFIVDLKCSIDRPSRGYPRPELVAPPPPGTLVTARVIASKPDRFDCEIYDAGVGYRREAVIWRPDTANLPSGVVPLQLRRGDVVTALTAEFHRAAPGKRGYWQLSITDPMLAVRAMASQVSEIIDGRIVVKQVARVMGACTKLVVAPTVEHLDARGACTSGDGIRCEAARRLINKPRGREHLQIIVYSSDRHQYLVNAMHPAVAVEVLIRGDNAIVAVPPLQVPSGVGQGGVNAELAGKLTGLYVEAVAAGTDLEVAMSDLQDRRRRRRTA
ncbi:hypothetical protein Ssi03_40570 [Sphaerisporangium siamense]|uniref:Transcription antitermination factor NusA-like protein n=1 Tax=Sphaerisporangium siamense TaxID=795645 RepID=A0A7W7DCU2_9ACTN|nr:hypothetical protein [Sphaerisporangium siamense]MBB4704458.1 transcription antitermination factor NusA-like protein [Sphaerisporangium siamense]GII86067.1 hypothetical protein Ssi03_40570 [Sphaerisporangium siamense]